MKISSVCLSGVFLIVFLNLFHCSVNPVSGRKQFNLYNEKAEIRLGEENYDPVNQVHYGKYPDENLNKYVSSVGIRLAKVSQNPDLPFEFRVVNSSVVNAYALPGGKIAITRGMLMKLQSEDALAAVLGHEIGHAVAKHTAVRMSYATVTQVSLLGLYAYLGIKGSRYANLYLLGAGATAQILLLAYSRSQESESDFLGLDYMVKAGYNPQGMEEVMEILSRLEKDSGGGIPVLLRSHPLSESRLKEVSAKINTQYADAVNKEKHQREYLSAVSNLYSRKEAYVFFDEGMDALGDEKYAEAENKFRKAAELYNREALFHAGLAHALLEQKKTDRARAEIENAIRINPEIYYIRLVKGIISYRHSNFYESIGEMQASLKLLPDAIPPRFYLAQSYDQLNDKPQSVRYYKEVYSLSPDSEFGKKAKEKLVEWGEIEK